MRDNAQYKTNSHFVSQDYSANARVTRGTSFENAENQIRTFNNFSYFIQSK